MAGSPGNRNALKHGFYAKSFTVEEGKALDRSRQDVLDEIKNLRIRANRIGRWLDKHPEVETIISKH